MFECGASRHEAERCSRNCAVAHLLPYGSLLSFYCILSRRSTYRLAIIVLTLALSSISSVLIERVNHGDRSLSLSWIFGTFFVVQCYVALFGAMLPIICARSRIRRQPAISAFAGDES